MVLALETGLGKLSWLSSYYWFFAVKTELLDMNTLTWSNVPDYPLSQYLRNSLDMAIIFDIISFFLYELVWTIKYAYFVLKWMPGFFLMSLIWAPLGGRGGVLIIT